MAQMSCLFLLTFCGLLTCIRHASRLLQITVENHCLEIAAFYHLTVLADAFCKHS